MAVLENVVLGFVKIQRAVLQYQSKTDYEYQVDAIVTEKQAKVWDKEFKKQKSKMIENKDFKEIYKIDLPFPDQEEQYVIKFKCDERFPSGDLRVGKQRPRVLMKNSEGKLEDFTAKTLVGNGSVGTIQYEQYGNDYGTFARLQAVRVDTLIPYGGGANYDELGEMDDTTMSELAPASTAAPKADADAPATDKPKVAADAPAAKLEDDDIPF